VARYLHDQHGADAVEFYDNNFFVHEPAPRNSPNGSTPGHQLVGRVAHRQRCCGTARVLASHGRVGPADGVHGAESGSDETLKRMNKAARRRSTKRSRWRA